SSPSPFTKKPTDLVQRSSPVNHRSSPPIQSASPPLPLSAFLGFSSLSPPESENFPVFCDCLSFRGNSRHYSKE
ncbi:hypothetical protein MKW98_015629, partial [Papaver atlanticum]